MKRIVLLLVLLALVTTLFLNGWVNWSLFSFLLLGLALAYLFSWALRNMVGSKELALLASLSALAALGRVPFAALPGVQPTTFLVICSGMVFGPQAGFLVGVTAALVSNFFLGHGPWTPWQMLGWGLIGLSAAVLARINKRPAPILIGLFGLIGGFLFGWLQNLGFWLSFVYPLTLGSFLATCASSILFDGAHALSNLLLCWGLYRPVTDILTQFKNRLFYQREPAGIPGEQNLQVPSGRPGKPESAASLKANGGSQKSSATSFNPGSWDRTN